MAAGGFLVRAGICCILALVLSACANNHLYDGAPLPDTRVALVEAERLLGARIEFAIDGKAVGSLAQYTLPPGPDGSWISGKPVLGVSVLPGGHSLTARLARYGWITAAQTGCASVMFKTEIDRRYRLSVVGDTLVMKDSNSGAEIAREPFSECPRQAAIVAR